MVSKTPGMVDGWQNRAIESLVGLSDPGVWGAENSDGTAVLRSTNFTKSGKLDLDDVAFREIEDKKLAKKLLTYGDILLERSGGGPKQPVGRVVYFDCDGEYVYGNFIQRLRASSDVLSKFLFYQLFWMHQSGKTEQLQQQTTGIRNLNFKDYMSTELSTPPLSEQRKIAAILTSVDDAITTTQRIIDQTEVVKRGLMQQLLTKGIGHTTFKQTEIGEIPTEWDVSTLSELGKWSGGGTPSKSRGEYWTESDGGIPWVSPKDMGNDVVNESQDKITELAVREKGLTIFPRGSILIVMRSGILRNSVPISLARRELTINQDLKALLVSEQHCEEYIFYMLKAFDERIR